MMDFKRWLRPSPSSAAVSSGRSSRWALPTLCRVCRAWQPDPICARCIATYARPAPRCSRCASRLGREGQACQRCEDDSPEFDRALAAVDYGHPWADLVTRLKFHDDTGLSRPMAQLMARCAGARPAHSRPDLMVPVPLSAARLQERGYNQAWLLARQLGFRCAVPSHAQVLHRVRDTQRLMQLDADERRAHIRDAFAVEPRHAHLVEGRHIALVDDVLTTGATVNEASRTLFEAGARSVSVWVFSRTPLPTGGEGPL